MGHIMWKFLFCVCAGYFLQSGVAEDGAGSTCGAGDSGGGERCTNIDNATTVRELGVAALSAALGRQPIRWQETVIAPILASIGEGNYGEISRLRLEFGDDAASALPLSVISKRVVPKPESLVPQGALNAIEHARFLQSFVVEVASYANLSDHLSEAGLAAPRLLYATTAQLGLPFVLLLEDLSDQFPRGANSKDRQMSPQEVRASVRWLAGFHALCWEDPRAEERGLWRHGSYWILDKLGRLEFEAVPKSYANRYMTANEWRRLRGAASAIDARLAGRPANESLGAKRFSLSFRTLVHGDAKPANILCSSGRGYVETTCAGLDFAWTGEGYGMRDVMYLLWGEWSQQGVDQYLQDYHAELLRRLPHGAGDAYTPAVMLQHFELCVVDFIRWWAGYRKGSYFWAMPWAMDILRRVLDRLDGGSPHANEIAYAEAVDREFPLS